MKIRSTTKTVTAASVLAAILASAAPATAATPDSTALAKLAAAAPARESGPTTFASLSDADLWSHIEASAKRAVVGLKELGHRRGVWQGTVLTRGAQRKGAKAALLGTPGVQLVSEDSILPVVTVTLDSLEALRAVRSLKTVDYVEPGKMDAKVHSDGGWGCMESTEYKAGGKIYSAAIATTYPGDGVPWNYELPPHPGRLEPA